MELPVFLDISATSAFDCVSCGACISCVGFPGINFEVFIAAAVSML